MSVRALAALLLLQLLVFPGSARAEAHDDSIAGWWLEITQSLESAAEPYKIRPPIRVQVRWSPRKIWSGELASEVVAMRSIDLGDDGKNELVVLTGHDLFVFSRFRGLFDVRMQAPLPVKLADQRSRDAIGALAISRSPHDALRLRARSSETAAGGNYEVVDGSLRLHSEFSGYPLCGEGSIRAALGRNYFLGDRAIWPKYRGSALAAELAAKLFAVSCTDSVASSGRAIRYISEVSTAGVLRIHCIGGDLDCPEQGGEIVGVGDAHAIADVDNDGVAEAIYAGLGAPFSSDRLVVMAQDADGWVSRFEREFSGGIVAIATGDFAGDGVLEVVAAVREHASSRVELWLLN